MSENSYDSDFTYSTKSVKTDLNFQNKLLKLMKEKGVVDKLKTQVRQNLISEIAAKESIFNIKNNSNEKPEKSFDIFSHSASSVIYEYLDKNNFHFTKSVFAPESGIKNDKFYTAEELLRVLQLDRNSEFYKKLQSDLLNTDKSFILCLLKTISEYHAFKQSEIEIQTDKPEKFIPLSEKMQKLDLQFEDRQKKGILKTQQLYEDRIVAFQRDIEKRLRQEMENEIQRFKDHEILSIKRNGEEEFNKTLKSKLKMIEEEYQNRLTALKDRERTSQENLQQFKESQERENYFQRQQILRDLSNIQERELQIKKEKERLEREFEMMKEQHKIKLNQVEERNSKLKELEMEIDMRITQEVNSYKLNEEKRLVQKWKEVEVFEMKLQEKLTQETIDHLLIASDENNENYSSLNDGEEKKYLESDKCIMEKLKEELTKRQYLFNEMDIISYPVLKQQNNTLLDQIEELKQQVQQQNIINQQDKHKISCLLKQKMGPNFEQSVLSNELERARDIFKRERTVLDEQKEALEKRLLEEIKSKRILTDQLSQQQDLVEMLSRQCSENKDVSYRNKSGFISSRSQNYGLYSNRNPPTNRDSSPHSPTDRRRKLSNFESARNEFPHEVDEYILPTEIEDLTTDAKHKLMNLDEETEQINKAYFEFKNRMANSFSKIGEFHPELQPELVSQSFKNGIEEGRRLKKTKSNELPIFFESNYHMTSFPLTNEKILHKIQETDMADNHERNIAKTNYSEGEIITRNDGNYENESDNPVQVSPFPNISNYHIENNNVYPEPDILENDIKSVSSVDSEPNLESERINLDQNWRNFNNDTKNQNFVVSNERDKVDNSAVKMRSESAEDGNNDEIDPVMKKYMELVKKKKEIEMISGNTDDPGINPAKFTLRSESEPESEIIKSISENSNMSNKKESPIESESESFW